MVPQPIQDTYFLSTEGPSDNYVSGTIISTAPQPIAI